MLVLGQGDTFGINRRFGAPEKSLVLILVKQTQNVAWVYIIMLIIVITQFCPGSISSAFSVNESREVSLNGNVYDFSVYYNSIDKSDILNIHKYLMTKNNIK